MKGVRFLRKCENGRRRWFRLLEKGNKHHEVPVHHKAQDYVAEYLKKAGFEPNKPLGEGRQLVPIHSHFGLHPVRLPFAPRLRLPARLPRAMTPC
jgi:hypothetical protein